MAGVVSICQHCGASLWDEETANRYCRYCFLPWGKYELTELGLGYCDICGNSKPECKCIVDFSQPVQVFDEVLQVWVDAAAVVELKIQPGRAAYVVWHNVGGDGALCGQQFAAGEKKIRNIKTSSENISTFSSKKPIIDVENDL